MLGLSRRHFYEQSNNNNQEVDRGRGAERPSTIPRAGWRDILWRVYAEQSEDNIAIIAAGVAYFALLALFPSLVAMVSIYGLIADPGTVERQIAGLSGMLPPEALNIVTGQLKSITAAPTPGLGVGLIVSLLLTLWSASKGINALITALNITYDEEEHRGYLRLTGLSLLLTLGAILFFMVVLALVVGVPAFIASIDLPGLGPAAKWLAGLLPWPILAVAIMTALAVLYRYGPDRRQPKWRWVSWGAAAATLLWLLGSLAFSIYVANFADYNKTYGSIGAVVILLLWLNLGAYAVLLGAELNAEIEHQTARDTTAGGYRPMGRRRAYVADTVGRRS